MASLEIVCILLRGHSTAEAAGWLGVFANWVMTQPAERAKLGRCNRVGKLAGGSAARYKTAKMSNLRGM